MNRVYYDKSLGKNADEHLEVVFSQLYNSSLTESDKALLPDLLKPYEDAFSGKNAVPFGTALSDYTQARRWAEQFGNLSITKHSGRARQYEVYIIHPDRGRCDTVTHSIASYACVMAGVQVMREHAYLVLAGKTKGNRAH